MDTRWASHTLPQVWDFPFAVPQVLMALLHCTQDALPANNCHKELWICSFRLFSRGQDQMPISRSDETSWKICTQTWLWPMAGTAQYSTFASTSWDNGIRSSVGRKCPAPPNELTPESPDSHFTVKWWACFWNGVDAVATASLVLPVTINLVKHIPAVCPATKRLDQ